MTQNQASKDTRPEKISDINPSFNRGEGVSFQYQEQTFLWTDQQSAALRRLYSLGVRDQWDPDIAIDWSLEIPYGQPLTRDVGLENFLNSSLGNGGEALWNKFRWEYQIWLVSQFFHGEQAALVGAARLAQSQKSLAGKQFAATQIMDEARHAEVFRRYLTLCPEATTYDISKPFASLVTSALSHRDWDLAALGVQIMIEGVALAAFRIAETTLHDDLIRSIVKLVHRDEARHTAFGMISLSEHYKELTLSERRERSDFIAAAAELTAKRFLLGDVWERIGIPVKKGQEFAATDPLMSAYRRAIFSKVISTIRRIGLLDDRLASDLEKMGYTIRRKSKVFT